MIQHMVVDFSDATATVDYSNRPTAQDAVEILLGFQLGAYSIALGDGEEHEVTIDAETRAELEEIAAPAVEEVEAGIRAEGETASMYSGNFRHISGATITAVIVRHPQGEVVEPRPVDGYLFALSSDPEGTAQGDTVRTDYYARSIAEVEVLRAWWANS